MGIRADAVSVRRSTCRASYTWRGRNHPCTWLTSRSDITLNRILGLLLLTVLLGMGTTSVISIGREVIELDPLEIEQSLTLGQEERIARGLALCERRLGQPEGKEYALYCMLRDHSESRAQVFLLIPEPVRAVAVQSHLNVLLHPKTIWILDRLPEGWNHMAAGIEDPVYIVQEDRHERPGLARHCDLLQDARGIRLWKFQREHE